MRLLGTPDQLAFVTAELRLPWGWYQYPKFDSSWIWISQHRCRDEYLNQVTKRLLLLLLFSDSFWSVYWVNFLKRQTVKNNARNRQVSSCILAPAQNWELSSCRLRCLPGCCCLKDQFLRVLSADIEWLEFSKDFFSLWDFPPLYRLIGWQTCFLAKTLA